MRKEVFTPIAGKQPQCESKINKGGEIKNGYYKR
jgi:hypothetical protein